MFDEIRPTKMKLKTVCANVLPCRTCGMDCDTAINSLDEPSKACETHSLILGLFKSQLYTTEKVRFRLACRHSTADTEPT